jgi:hsdS specificity protein of type I restriction-modification system
MIKVNKPKIRFNEFENIWTKSKLGELYEIYSGNTPSRSDSRNYQNGEIPWIKTTDLNNSIICSNEEKISVYGATKLKVLPEKSVLIAMYGGFNQIGRTGLLVYPATINQALAALMPINEINPNFLLNFLNFKKESWRNVAASSRKDPNITKNDVEKFIISFPSLEEQSAIGSLFRILDDLLASYKENLANYQSLKATMLSKMFPKAGQTVPEIRLDGFDGEWEIKKFKSISNKRGKSNSKGYDYPAYSVSNQSGLIPQSEQFEGSRLENLEKTSYKIVEPNEFAYNPARINVGSIAFNDLHETVIVSSLYVIFSLDKSMDNNYALLFIKSAEFNKEVRRNTEGSVREYLFYENFANIRIPIPPSLEEQHAIGIYFSNLDNLINSHQEKISQLETLKKKLLQDMFI